MKTKLCQQIDITCQLFYRVYIITTLLIYWTIYGSLTTLIINNQRKIHITVYKFSSFHTSNETLGTMINWVALQNC